MSRQGPLSRPAPAVSVSGVRVGLATTRSALMSGQTRVVDHVEAVLDRIDTVDKDLGAYVSVAAESARRAAAHADERIRRHGRAAWRRQPMLGVTVAVKDLIQTGDLPTTRGSLNRNDRAAVDAPIVARLRMAGAIVVGKTTTSEYGWSASSASRVAPATRNPWSPRHSAGGSSGGSAAAVAAGLCDVALGTDGAGSIRIPAAFCGIVGFKPTQGLIPYLPTCVNRLSHLGPMVNRVADAVELTQFAAGGDPRDPDSLLRLPSRSRTRAPLRVAWIDFPGTDPVVRQTAAAGVEALRGLGHHVTEIDPPFTDPYLALLTVLAAAEAAATAPDQEPGADAGRLAVVRYGRTLSAAAVMRAEAARMRLRATMAEVMGRYDIVASCTVPVEPFAVDAIGPSWAADPEDLLWLSWAPACYPFNLTGQPAISLPVGMTPAGLPVGVQLVGPVGGDVSVLALAGRLEAELAVVAGPPPVPVVPGSPPAPDKGD